jgi:S-adenosyl methyltransferase
MLIAVLHFIPDEDEPGKIIAALLDALPPGSYLAASHTTAEHDRERWASLERSYRSCGIRGQLRDSGEFAQLAFAGLELVPPGVVSVSEWRPEGSGLRPALAEVSTYGGMARKL